VTEQALHGRGVRTIGDLRRVPEGVLKRLFGAHGGQLHRLAHGIDERPVETDHEAKSIGHEDTYEHDLLERGTMRRELLSLSDRVSARLRRHGLKGKTVTLKVKYADFVQVTRAATLPDPTDDGGTLYRVALDLLVGTDAGSRPVRLLGISVSRLSPAEEATPPRTEQLPLFGGGRSGRRGGQPVRPDPEKRERLNRAVDRIREKYGTKGIAPGALPDTGKPER
jgi:DNA polymerase-4